MTVAAPVISRRHRRSRPCAALTAGVALLALLTAASSAEAQAKVYVLGYVSEPGVSGLRQVLTVVDGATNQKGVRLTLGLSAGVTTDMAMPAAGDRIYVANYRDATVSVVDTATDTVIDTLPKSLVLCCGILSAPLDGVEVSPDGRHLFLRTVGVLSIIDVATKTAVNRVGPFPLGDTVLSRDGSRLYIRKIPDMGGAGAGIEVYDVAALMTATTPSQAFIAAANLPTEPNVSGVNLSVSSDDQYVFLPRPRPSGVSSFAVFDTTTNTFIHDRPTPNAYATAAKTSPNSAYLYVIGNQPQNQLYRFSPTTFLELSTTSGVQNSYDLAFTADSAQAYVAASHGVYVINTSTHTVRTTIPFGGENGSPRLVAVLGANPIDPTPSNFRLTAINGNRVSFAWNAPAGQTPSGYVIRGGLTPGSVLGSVATGSPATSFTFDAPSGVFYLRVHAVTPSGVSPASNEIQVFINVPLAPSPPTGLRGLADGSNLALSWTNMMEPGVPTSLDLLVSGAANLTVAPLPLTETFSFTGVPPGTYTFSVRARNATGASAPSGSVTLTFPGVCAGPPQVPTNVVVQRAGSLVSVTWDAPAAGPAVTGYVLNVTGAAVLNVRTSVRRVAADAPSGTYNLSVLAVNPCGASAETVPQSITVP